MLGDEIHDVRRHANSDPFQEFDNFFIQTNKAGNYWVQQAIDCSESR
jgi:hypothetical protein